MSSDERSLVERLEHHSLYVGLAGHTNNAVTSNLLAEAAAALRAPEAADAGAVAWIEYAENGNIRFWTDDAERAHKERSKGRYLHSMDLGSLMTALASLRATATGIAAPPDVVLDHLGNVLYMLAELHEDDQPRAYENALSYYNAQRPEQQVLPVEGYSTRLVHTTPLDAAPPTVMMSDCGNEDCCCAVGLPCPKADRAAAPPAASADAVRVALELCADMLGHVKKAYNVPDSPAINLAIEAATAALSAPVAGADRLYTREDLERYRDCPNHLEPEDCKSSCGEKCVGKDAGMRDQSETN